MAYTHRKLLNTQNSPSPSSNTTIETCLYFCHPLKDDPTSKFCPTVCLAICPSICHNSLSDLLPPPISPHKPNTPHNLSPLLISMLTILASTFLLITIYTLYKNLFSPQTRPRIRNNPVDEEHGRTVVFHPIWYIPTVGLNPKSISSITVIKYVRGEKGTVHVDGRGCAICLGEFQDGDEVRVLPKCNHSFHIICIDTWLKSHVNCPLCRAQVIVPSDHDPDQSVDNSSSPSLPVPSPTEDHSPGVC